MEYAAFQASSLSSAPGGSEFCSRHSYYVSMLTIMPFWPLGPFSKIKGPLKDAPLFIISISCIYNDVLHICPLSVFHRTRRRERVNNFPRHTMVCLCLDVILLLIICP